MNFQTQQLSSDPSLEPTDHAPEVLSIEQRQLRIDQDLLRLHEEELREYEARLRALQDEIDASRRQPLRVVSSRSEAALQTEWHNLHRARALLEAEQAHLRDDRIKLREQEATLTQREQAAAAREEELARAEAEIATADELPASRPDTASPLHVARMLMRAARLT